MQSWLARELGRKNGFLRPRKAKCMMTGEIKIPGPGQKGMLYIKGIMSVQKGVKRSTMQRYHRIMNDLCLWHKNVEIEFSRLYSSID